jgi:hypothetical protein
VLIAAFPRIFLTSAPCPPCIHLSSGALENPGWIPGHYTARRHALYHDRACSDYHIIADVYVPYNYDIRAYVYTITQPRRTAAYMLYSNRRAMAQGAVRANLRVRIHHQSDTMIYTEPRPSLAS